MQMLTTEKNLASRICWKFSFIHNAMQVPCSRKSIMGTSWYLGYFLFFEHKICDVLQQKVPYGPSYKLLVWYE